MRRYVVALALVLAGCTSTDGGGGGGGGDAKAAGAQPWLDDTRAAVAAGPVGAKGSACPLPVSFEVAKSWKPKAVEALADDKLESLMRQGDFTLVCEIDAKPAGMLGFLRVWSSPEPDADPRKALEAYVGTYKYATEQQYREVKAGSVTAAEATYISAAPESDKKRERVLAVATPKGVVVLHLGGLDTDEHEQMLPAYVLAKQSLKVL
jgi:hypothetical protein